MGMLDSLRNFFKGSNNTPAMQATWEQDDYKKSMLATQIVNLVDQIKQINSFDSSIWNLSNISNNELKRKSLAELETLQSRLYSRLSELTKQSQRKNPEREALDEAAWTGRKPKNLTNNEFDRLQRYDGSR